MPESIESKALHYLYFPDSRAAKAAAKEITQMGLESELRLSADEENWLLLVKHGWPTPGKEFDQIEKTLERVANAHAGEYDGNEIPLSEN